MSHVGIDHNLSGGETTKTSFFIFKEKSIFKNFQFRKKSITEFFRFSKKSITQIFNFGSNQSPRLSDFQKNQSFKMAAIIGCGFVGSAMIKSFTLRNVQPLGKYDKFKNGGMGSLEECTQCPIIFLSLPTLYDHDAREYDKSAIVETLRNLSNSNYNGIIVIKSTVEPGTTDAMSKRFPKLHLMHNPEFLSAATAFEDFDNQDHIVIGQGRNCTNDHLQYLHDFYRKYYKDAEISTCRAIESESMKSFVNTFYSVKIQFFNELYLLCKMQGSNFNVVKELMIKNNWINPMHTAVPGHDGKLSYGGACFPKDTNALLQCMKKNGIPHSVLEGCVRERNILRGDKHLNLKLAGSNNNNNNNKNNNNNNDNNTNTTPTDIAERKKIERQIYSDLIKEGLLI